jgi:branched-chain amino acid transport system substrate-binding protein
MRRRHALSLAAVACTLAWPSRARSESGVSAREVVIGQSIALQGGRNAYGVEALAGITAVFDAVNAAGGVLGRRLILRTLDDQNDAGRAAAHARQLIDGGAFVLFGSIEGGPSTAVAAEAEAARVPFIGPMAGSPGLRRPHQPMVFPVRAEHREEFRALIGWARRIGLTRMALLHSDSEVGRAHLANTQLLCTEAGAQLAYGVPLKNGIDDAGLQQIVQRLQREPVQFMFNHGSAATYGRLIGLARQAGVDTTFMGINSGSTELARALGPAARGMVFAQVMPNPWARRTALVRDYQQTFRRQDATRALSYASLEGHATARALEAALRLAGPTLSRTRLVQVLEAADIDLGGLPLRYRPGDHEGARFVDLAIVTRDGGFLQ